MGEKLPTKKIRQTIRIPHNYWGLFMPQTRDMGQENMLWKFSLWQGWNLEF
jgi:hypothetical protein